MEAEENKKTGNTQIYHIIIAILCLVVVGFMLSGAYIDTFFAYGILIVVGIWLIRPRFQKDGNIYFVRDVLPNLVEELRKEGYDISMLSLGEDIEDVYPYGSGYLVEFKDMPDFTTLVVEKPGFIEGKFMNLSAKQLYELFTKNELSRDMIKAGIVKMDKNQLELDEI